MTRAKTLILRLLGDFETHWAGEVLDALMEGEGISPTAGENIQIPSEGEIDLVMDRTQPALARRRFASL